MNDVLDWLTESSWVPGVDRWALLLFVLITLVNLVVGLTPTKKDDRVVKKIMVWLAVVVPRNVFGTLKLPFTLPELPEDEEHGS